MWRRARHRVRRFGGIPCETATGPARASLEQDRSPAGFSGGAPTFEIKSVDGPPRYVFKGLVPRRQTCHIHCKNCGLASQASKSIVKTDTWRSQPPTWRSQPPSKKYPEFVARISPARERIFPAPQFEGPPTVENGGVQVSSVRTTVKMEASWLYHHQPL